MNISRIVPALRVGTKIANKSRVLPKSGQSNVAIFQQATRNHGEWNYRKLGIAPEREMRRATFCMSVLWWWIGWFLIEEYRSYFGLDFLPSPSSWTDEELGIPPE